MEKDFRTGATANLILYLGLGLIAIGLVITTVGAGDKGFKTFELRVVGPSIVTCGFVFVVIRVLICTVTPDNCKCCTCLNKTEEESEKLIANPQQKAEEEESKNNKTANNSKSRPSNGAVIVNNSVTIRNVKNNKIKQQINTKTPKMYDSDDDDNNYDEEKELVKAMNIIQKDVRMSFRRSNQVGTFPGETVERQYRGDERRLRRDVRRAISTDSSTASSSFSLTEAGRDIFDLSTLPKLDNLEGSRRNLRMGGIILNASRLRIESDTNETYY